MMKYLFKNHNKYQRNYHWITILMLIFSCTVNAADIVINWPDDWQHQVVDRSVNHLRLVAVHNTSSDTVDKTLEVHAVNLQPSGNARKKVGLTELKELAASLRENNAGLAKEKNIELHNLENQNGYYFIFTYKNPAQSGLNRQQLEVVMMKENYLLTFTAKFEMSRTEDSQNMLDLIEGVQVEL